MNEAREQEAARFLKRTFKATLISIVLVVLISSTKMGGKWALDYGAVALWALVFFTLTPLIVKFMLLDERKGLGLLLILAKLGWVCSFGALLLGAGEDGPFWALSGSAAVAGVSTPLVVLVLRVAGAASERRRMRSE